MFYLKHVLWTLTLQTGTLLLTAIFFTLAFCITSVNLRSVNINASSMAWIIMILYVYFAVIIWGIAFVAAIQEWRKGISIAVVSWTIHCMVWVGLVLWSFILAQPENICIGSKCPDVLWLLENPWCERKLDEVMQISVGTNKTSIKTVERPIYEKKTNPQNIRNLKKRKNSMDEEKQDIRTDISDVKMSNVMHEYSKEPLSEKIKSNTEITDESVGPICHLSNILTSIFLSIIYAIIFLFSWMVLVGYENEIQLNVDSPIEIT